MLAAVVRPPSRTGVWPLTSGGWVGPGQSPGGAEAPVDAHRQPAALEHGEARQDAGDGPARHGHEFIDGRPPQDELAPEPSGGLTHPH